MNAATDELIREFVAEGRTLDDWRPAFSAAPRTTAPIVRQWVEDESSELHRDVDAAQWGLRPSWAKEGGPAARLESVATNGMFRSAFASQRCIVPMSGYFEWEAREDGKQPYFIRSADAGTLAAAGLYAARKEGDEWPGKHQLELWSAVSTRLPTNTSPRPLRSSMPTPTIGDAAASVRSGRTE